MTGWERAPTRQEVAEGFAILREHAYVMNRIVMASMRDDHALIDTLSGRLAELDAELRIRWGLGDIPSWPAVTPVRQ